MIGRRAFVAAAVVVAALAGGVAPAQAAPAPTGLKAFLLRADEPASRSFARTPSFAWNPVAGAQRYEFQLSTSSAFRESGIVYSDTSLTSPVASPSLMLPWISGSPHSLYARVRAVLDDGPTEWSGAFGFDMDPPPAPRPLPSYPGLLRWTPSEGAAAYQIWFVDIPKMVLTKTNVADLREFYTFHQAASWLGQVRWRVRASRNDFNARANGLPAARWGPWSPVYTSVNPPFATGPLRPTATVSDVVATGDTSAPHRLMPAFVFGGNRSFANRDAELYRVHVFTDRRCVNRVYTSAIIGSPAYAPRLGGTLALPRTGAALAAARSAFLPDGDEGATQLADFDAVTPNEVMEKAKPTKGLPSGAPAPAAPAAPAPGTPAPTAPAAPAGTVDLLRVSGEHAPVHLWDSEWGRGGGYYWTVVPVEAAVPGSASSAVAAGGASAGATQLPVANASVFAVGDIVNIGSGTNAETATITATGPGTVTVAAPLRFSHGTGETVLRTSGGLQYRDLELAQDACAGGRVLRFGKESEPTLTAGGELFATGLSPSGRLVSATAKPSFYGAPLVGWTAALGADAYAVQWSKTRSPFRPETDPATNALGLMTLNTSAVLPLQPGTWYYRVRGYDWAMPTNAQAMSWSEPQRLVVARPTFEVVSGGSSERPEAATKVVRVPAAGFSLSLPRTFRSQRTLAAAGSLRPLGAAGSVLRLVARDARGGSAVFVETKPAPGSYSHRAWARAAAASAQRTPGRVGAVRCANVSLPAGAAVRCTLNVRADGATRAATLVLLRHRGATYTVTLVGRSGDAPRLASVARSFRFTA